jgi:aspartate/glutamate/glutamine transport system substrate-binding protein
MAHILHSRAMFPGVIKSGPKNIMREPDTRKERRCVAVLLITLLTLSACTLPPIQLENIARIAATGNPADSAPSATVAPPDVSTAALVKERRKLRVGIRFDAPPLASVTDDGKLEGLDVDIAREFARRWLGSEQNVEFIQVTSSSAPRKIERREVDLALGGLVHSKAAETHADFSLPYMQDGEALLARTGTYADFGALALRSVTYVDGSSTPALGAAQIAANITVSLQTARSYAAAIQQLRDGQTDAVAGRWRRLRAVAGRDPALTVITVFNREPVAVMLPQNDSDWADLVNDTLSALIADGSYATMYQQWFTAPPDSLYALPNAIDIQLAALPDTTSARNGVNRLRSTNTVRIGFVAQADPLATLDETGQPIGFEIDVCRELARRWFQNAGAAEFTALPASDIPGLLRNDTIDMAVGAIVQTQANERIMDFSVPTFQSGVGVAVLQTSEAIDLSGLNGRVVGLVQSRSDQAILDQVKATRNLNLGSLNFPDFATALGALRSGQVDAVLEDEVTLLALARSSSDIRILGEMLTRVPIAIALPTGDSSLRDFVNLTMQEMMADGTYARIYQAWFGNVPMDLELWPGEASQGTALIAPTATALPTITPVFEDLPTATPAPQPTAPPAPPAETPTPQQ